jgi:putative tricarboxylic transport membrane protein
MKINDAVFGALFGVLSLLVLWTIQGYPRIPGQNFGPAAFPGMAAFGLAVCSLLLVVQGLRARRDAPWFTAGDWVRRPAQLIAFLVTVAGLALYVVASEKVGFLIVGTLIVTALMLSLRVRAIVALPAALLATFAIHVAFYKGLRVPLPWGVLPVLY